MISIDVPTVSSNVSQSVSLNGLVYTFKYTYNSIVDRLYLSIYLEEEEVILGLKLLPSEFLLSTYILSGFDHGDLIVARFQGDGEADIRATLGTIGIDLPYELIYVSNEELDSYVVN